MKNKHSLVFKATEGLFVAGFLIFEELIWNILAKPVIDCLRKLKFLERFRQLFLDMNRYGVLTIFLVIFALTEYLGILSGFTIMSGEVKTGVIIYLLKVPVAAFSFWLFDLTQPKLMTFSWLASVYSNLMHWKSLLMATATYQSLKASVLTTRNKIKQMYQVYCIEQGLLESVRTYYQWLKSLFMNLR